MIDNQSMRTQNIGLFCLLLLIAVSLIYSSPVVADETSPIEREYQQARDYFNNQNYEKAKFALESLLDRSPHAPLKRKMHYLLGVTLKNMGDAPTESLRHFHRVYSDTPTDDITDDALFYSAEILYKQLEQPGTAIPYLGTIRSHFPDADFNDEARNLLASIDDTIDTQSAPGPKTYSPGNIPPPKVKLNFREVELQDFINTYSEITGTNFLIGTEISGTITLIGKDGIPVYDLFEVFIDILETRGYTAVKQKNHYKIQQVQRALQGGVGTEKSRSGLRSEFFNMKGLPWNDVINAINSLLPQSKNLIRMKELNRILVTARPSSLETVASTLDTFRNMKIHDERTVVFDYTPEHVGLTEVSSKLETLLSNYEDQENFNILTSKNTGKLMVVLPSSKKDRAEILLRQIDRDVDDKLTDQLEVEIFRLEHAKVDQIEQKITELLDVLPGNFASENIKIVTDKRQKALIVSSTSSNALSIIRNTIDELDRKSKTMPENIRVFQLKHANEEDVSQTLQEIKNLLPGEYPGGEVKFIANERRRSIIVAAESTKVFGIVEDVIDQLDKSDVQQPMSHHVYNVKNSDAGPLAEKLTSLFEAQEQPDDGRALRVTADEQSNSLVVSASSQQWDTVKRMLERLDRPKKQVLVDVYIAEASRDNIRELGVQWNAEGLIKIDNTRREVRGGPNFEAGSLEPPTDASGNPLNPARPARSLFGVFEPGGNSLQAILTAFDEKNKIELLSSSHIVANDNEESTLSVGRIVPLKTQEQQSTSGQSSVVNSFEFEDVGVELKLTPTLGSDSEVTLSIKQSIEEVIDSEGQGLPVRRTRDLQTKVAVPNSTTLVLGGLMRTQENTFTQSVPYLGNIPGLGWLFKEENTTTEQRNLLAFLQPHIVSGKESIQKASQEMNAQRKQEKTLKERLDHLENQLGSTESKE